MKFTNFINYFSSPRIGRYMVACCNDKKKCAELYKSNLKLAQAFHPLLGILEVVLRNGINDQLILHFLDENWIINQKNGFMIDPILTHTDKRTGLIETNRFILNSVKGVERKLRNRGISITSGRIVAEQPFGFWTDLFENHHYKILMGRPIKLFKNLPPRFGRTEVLHELSKVRRFRNRINHNEPICFVGTFIDFSQTLVVYQSILNLLNWINPELIVWIKDIDKINPMLIKLQRV